MNAPSERVIKKLFALSKNQCAFASCSTSIVQPGSETVTGEVCHIKAKNPKGPRFDPKQTDEERHGFDNLVLMCGFHHTIIDDQPEIYTVEKLRQIKQTHEQYVSGPVEISPTDAALARALYSSYIHIEAKDHSQVMMNSPGSVQAHNITYKTTSKKSAAPQPTDVIGANADMRSYIEYLVKRYIDWRKKGISSGKDKRPFHPSMIHQHIEKTFSSRTFLIKQSRFEALVGYLHSMIDGTINGQLNAYRNYHTYVEHLEELQKKPRKAKRTKIV
jgi:hypothetical protein